MECPSLENEIRAAAVMHEMVGRIAQAHHVMTDEEKTIRRNEKERTFFERYSGGEGVSPDMWPRQGRWPSPEPRIEGDSF